MLSMCGGWQLLSKTLRSSHSHGTVSDGVRLGHDSKNCSYCRSDRLNKRNKELVKFGKKAIRGLAEKIRLVRIRQ